MKLSDYQRQILEHAQRRNGRVTSIIFRRSSLNALAKRGLLCHERKEWFFITDAGINALNLAREN